MRRFYTSVALILAFYGLHAQSITITLETTSVVASPLVPGTTGQNIFGIKLDKSAGAGQLTDLIVQLSQNPAGKFTNPQIWRSTDNTLDGGDTPFAGSFVGNTAVFTASPLTTFGGAGAASRWFFLTVDVAAAATGNEQPSLSNTDLTADITVNAATITGTNYSFLTTSIGTLNAGANNVAGSPLLAGASGQAIFGFSLTSGGSQTVTLLDFPVTSTPTGKLATFSLVRSADADFATGGDNTTIGGLTFGTTASLIRITAGLSETITSTAKNYFLVANVDPAVTGATPALQVSLPAANVTAGTGAVAGTATGTNYSFATLTTTITSLNAGANNVALSPLLASSPGKAIFGFSLTSNGSQTVTLLDFPVTSNPAGVLGTYSLVRSVDADFATGGDNTTIGGLTFGTTASLIQITAGLSEAITTSAKNYFLVADINAGVTGATPAEQVSLGAANVTAGSGGVTGSATGTNYSFAVLTATIASLNAGANNVALSPLVSSATGKAIFGFSLASNGSQTVTLLDFPVTSDPAGKLGTYSLVRSTDSDFATAGDNTTIGGLTISATTTLIQITAGLSETITSTPKNYFLVANVNAAVTGATPAEQVSLGAANVTVGSGNVTGSATGTNYSFAALTLTIASLNGGANNVALSPLAAGATGKAIFGFSLTSNGSQTVTLLDFPVTSDPAGKLATYSLVRSTDSDFGTAGDNTTIPGLTISATTTLIRITAGLVQPITTTRNYFLVANVDPAVTGVTPSIQVSLAGANVTAGTGTVSGSATGTNYSFAPLTLTLASLNAGANNVAPSPLVASATGRAVFGFSLTSNASQTVTLLDFPVTSDPTGKLGTFSLVRSVDADFGTAGDNVTVPGLTFSNTASLVQITAGLSEVITTSTRNYFLVANVNPAVTGATPAIQVSLPAANVTASIGSVTGSATGTNYSFQILTLTLNAITNGLAPSPLGAGSTGNAILGFSLTSNFSQTVTLLDFPVSSDPAGKLGTFSLVRSTDNDFATAGDNTTVGGLTFNATTSLIQITAGLSETVTTTPRNYFLVAVVNGSVTTATAALQASLTQANVTVSSGSVTAGTVTGTNYSFSGSQTSAIITNAFTGQTSIDFAEYSMQTASGLTTANSQKLFSFDIRDNDPDNQTTTVNSLILQLSAAGAANLKAIVLIDNLAGTPIPGSEQTVSAVLDPFDRVSFPGISIVVADGSAGTPTLKSIDVYATFNTPVTDNTQISVAVSAVTALATGSGMGPLGTVQTTAGRNPINVVATEMQFTGVSPLINPNINFGLTVNATDAGGNIDVNKSSNVTLSKQSGTGTLSSTDPGNLVRPFSSGAVSWAQLKITNPAGLYTLRATDAGGLPLKDIVINVQSLGIIITPLNATVCPVGTASFFTTLPDLVLTENEAGDMVAGTNLTYLLFAPAGFEFNNLNDTVVTSFAPGKNVTAVSAVTYIGKTTARFTYSVNAIDQVPDQITISGLTVRNVSAVAAGTILRSGSGIMVGNDETKVQGTLTPGGSVPADFTVASSPGVAAIAPTEVNFPISSQPIILNGQVPVGTSVPGGTFSGPGVSLKFIGGTVNADRYIFSPAALNVGAYDITFSIPDPATGCISTKTKTFNVFSNAINGLQDHYCANDNTPKALTVNPLFIPSGYTTSTFSIAFPFPSPYKNFLNVINNLTSLTILSPGHGLTAGGTYPIYIYGSFSGPAVNNGQMLSPFGYEINGNFTISNVTTNSFDIAFSSGFLFGSWYGCCSYAYLDPNPVTNVVNNGTSLTITSANHGLQNLAKIRIDMDDLSLDGIYNYFSGWFQVSNVTANTFDIVVTATGTWTPAYNYTTTSIDLSRYEITTFTPNMASTLNSNLVGRASYSVGYFLKYTGCGPYWYCYEFPYNEQGVTLTAPPDVSFSGLLNDYCVSDPTPVLLKGGNSDGVFTASPSAGLVDGGNSNNTANFLPNSGGILPDSLISITYTFTDQNLCTNKQIQTTRVHSLPIVNAGINTSMCSSSSVIIGGPGKTTGSGPNGGGPGGPDFRYSWNNPLSLDDPTVPNPKAFPSITTTYTVTVTDRFGCNDTDQIVVTVDQAPDINAGPDKILCASATDINLTGTGNIIGATTVTGTWSGGAGTFGPNSLIATYHVNPAELPAVAPNTAPGSFTLLLTSDPIPGNVCAADTDRVKITIYPIPEAPTNPIVDYQYCVNDLIAPLTANSLIFGSSLNWYNTNPVPPIAFSGPSYATPTAQTVDALYTYYVTQVAFAIPTVFTGCESPPTQMTIRVNPLPIPKFTADKFCFGQDMTFLDKSTLDSATNLSRKIVFWQWDFSDGDILNQQQSTPYLPDDAVPAGLNNGGRTSGTFKNPMHKFDLPGTNYNVKLTVTSNDLRTTSGLGCSNSVNANALITNPIFTGPLKVGSLPLPEFAVNNICDEDQTKFTYTGTSTPGSLLMSKYVWIFGDSTGGFPNDSTVVMGPPVSPPPPPMMHTYDTVSSNLVSLTVTTDLNCQATIVKTVNILPYLKTYPSGGYIEDFDGGASGWFTEALNLNNPPNGTTSWQLATPASTIIDSAFSAPKAWITNAYTDPGGQKTYYNNERSVLNGPCFDMTDPTLSRPVLAFKYWNVTKAGDDGVYLEYSSDGGLNKDSWPANPAGSWRKLGAINNGLGWYDKTSILGLTPANSVGQPTIQEGWSGVDNGWKDGKFNVDGLKSFNRLRIRFVFGSNADNPASDILDGFAIDHFVMQNRNRTLLAENFTNLTADAGQANSNNFYNFQNLTTTNELVKIEYHFGIGGPDSLYEADKPDADARAGFYGVSRTSTNVDAFQGFVSGRSGGKFPAVPGGWSQATYDVESLVTSPLDISIATPYPVPLVDSLFHVQATINTNVIMDPGQYVVQIAMIEKVVGTSKFILRRMLPDASGTPLNAITAGSNQVIDASWNLGNVADRTQLAVVVFVQEVSDVNNKTVVQAKYEGNPALPPKVTGVDNSRHFESVAIYPNPAEREFTIQLPRPARQQVNLRLWDQVGKLVYDSFIPVNGNSKNVGTRELSSGVYILQMDSSDGSVGRVKVMVVHTQ